MKETQILDIMYSGSGTQFDPTIMTIFKELYESGEVFPVYWADQE